MTQEPADDAMRVLTAFLRLTPQTRHDTLLRWRMAVVWVIASMSISMARRMQVLSISWWRRSLSLRRLLLTTLLSSLLPGSFNGVRAGIQLMRTYHQQDLCQVISGQLTSSISTPSLMLTRILSTMDLWFPCGLSSRIRSIFHACI